MSHTSLLTMKVLIEPFSFKPRTADKFSVPKFDFTMRWIEEAEKRAATLRSGGDEDGALIQESYVAWWRSLQTMPDSKSDTFDVKLGHFAEQRVDALLTRAEVSKESLIHLFALLHRILFGLRSLAAHGNEEAAKTLLLSLHNAVDDFNELALHKPEAFLKVARDCGGIPGIISKSGEKNELNAELLKKLQVGTENPYAPWKAGKRMRLRTPVNRWASRLINYIINAKIMLEAPVELREPGFVAPSWATQAYALEPFSSLTWMKWFDLAWVIINEATNGHPENEPVISKLGESAKRKNGAIGKRGKPRNQTGNILMQIKGRFEKAFLEMAKQDEISPTD